MAAFVPLALNDVEALCARGLAAGRDWRPSPLQAQVQATCALGATPQASCCVITGGVIAERLADGWSLHGAAPAALVSETPVSEYLVMTRLDERNAVFIVQADASGLSSTLVESLDGLSAYDAVFDQVRVSDRSMPRTVNPDVFAPALVTLAAEIIGASSAALDLAVARARERKVFGRPIGSFQALAHRLVDAWIDLEAMQLALQEAAQDGLIASHACALKALCSAAGPRVVSTAQQVHGGEGYLADLPLHRYTRRVLGLSLRLGGSAEHHARLLPEVVP